MWTPVMTIQALRTGLALMLGFLMLLTPFTSLAQDATPPSADVPTSPSVAQMAPVPGSLHISLTGSTGLPLSGSVAVTDSADTFQEVWVSGGIGSVGNVAAGTATVTQLSGTTDYAVDATPVYVEVPEGGIGHATITNPFLDADGDGIGDSLDACPAGNDAIDTDSDGTADACDATPNGDPTPSPTAQSTATAIPTTAPTATATATATPADKVSRTSTNVMAASGGWAGVSMSPSTASAGTTQTFTVTINHTGGTGRLSSASIMLPAGFGAPSGVTITGSGSIGKNDLWVSSFSNGQLMVTAQNNNGEVASGGFVAVTFTTTLSTSIIAKQYELTTRVWDTRDWRGTAFTVSSQPKVTVPQVTSCALVSPSNKTLVGSYVMYRCSTTVSDMRLDVTSITGTWKWAYVFSDSANLQPPAFDSLTWASSTGSSANSAGRQHAYIFVTPMLNASIGSWDAGRLTINVNHPDPSSGFTHLATLDTSFVRRIEAGDFAMSCSPASVTPTADASATVTCQVEAARHQGSREAYVKIEQPISPPGWKVTATGMLENWNVKIGSPFTVTFRVEPDPQSATPGMAQTVVVPASVRVADETYTGLTGSFTINGATASSITASITSANLSWNQPYSHEDQVLAPGSLTYRVDATGSAGWNVNVSASEFSGANGGIIPASNLALTNSSLPEGQGLSRPDTSGTFDSDLQVLSASPGNGNGSFTQTLDVSLTVPGGTPADTYTSVVTITATSAPQN